MADKPVDMVARALVGQRTNDRWGRNLTAKHAIVALTAPGMRDALVGVVENALRPRPALDLEGFWLPDTAGAERVADAVMAWLRGDEPEAGR